jgi:hypothetical protein
LYRGYIRETIIKPGLTPTKESEVVDHVSFCLGQHFFLMCLISL